MRQHAPDVRPNQCDTPLSVGLARLETIGLGVTELFHRVLSGVLPFWLCQRGRVLFLEESRCDGRALRDWIATVKTDRGWISVEDMAYAVGASLPTLRRWIDAGVVPLKAAFGAHQYLDSDVIQRLTVGLLNGDSTTRWLAVPSSTLPTWIAAGWLTPVFVDPRGRIEHFLFDRDEVSQLSDRIHETRSHFITAGISTRWINDMIEAGRLNLLPPNASASDYESHALLARPHTKKTG